MSSPGEGTVVPGRDFTDRVRLIWRSLVEAERSTDYDNVEGGSVEQHPDNRLLLHHCANYAALLTLLEGRAQRLSLMELGCGSGALSAAFAAAMPRGWRLVATDYSESLLAHARRVHGVPGLSFEHLDVRHLEPHRLEGIDVVFLLEVIEHLPREEAARLLGRLHAGMDRGATLVLTTLDRSPFPRPHSGYAPHYVEYSCRSMAESLSDAGFSPFGEFRIHRLVSPRITREQVRAEQRGGYLLNRCQRALLGYASRHPRVERLRAGVMRGAYRWFAAHPRRDAFDLEGYLSTMSLVRDGGRCDDDASYGLVVELRKA